MKISIKHYNTEVSWDNNKPVELDDTNLEDAFDAFSGLLIAQGYSQEAIFSYITEWAEILNENN